MKTTGCVYQHIEVVGGGRPQCKGPSLPTNLVVNNAPLLQKAMNPESRWRNHVGHTRHTLIQHTYICSRPGPEYYCRCLALWVSSAYSTSIDLHVPLLLLTHPHSIPPQLTPHPHHSTPPSLHPHPHPHPSLSLHSAHLMMAHTSPAKFLLQAVTLR